MFPEVALVTHFTFARALSGLRFEVHVKVSVKVPIQMQTREPTKVHSINVGQ